MEYQGFYNLPSPLCPEFKEMALDIYMNQKYLLYNLNQNNINREENGSSQDIFKCQNDQFNENKNQINCDESPPQKRYWTDVECIAFKKAIKYFGYTTARGINTFLISAFVGTRTPTQVRSHAQKYFMKEKPFDVELKLSEKDIEKLELIQKRNYLRTNCSRIDIS
ncbi:Myb family DNA-binding protein, SHAQKYF family protein [Entamoeba histolytica HM-1:IMSS-B]|uniref:Myb family DNA-binding protein, SHAQKYF family n=6 Tax=Entamoeba histolytica TaxID=5759 RepID=C4LWA9_ENTH1|nr:Myb family DNA-binding protein, SHAQKYF family [Entamoeba histolytica HM-1:IMSS]EMD49316.1 Myb family DNAbinding protein shaqkyf family protein [Entamoeba histolytica KU27]EMH72761.1 Myb family DNA-binding protein, SHAQKYF family protein [Entamoeba histolytica HM-1:IMSS-B]EMS16563.1 Myb DNA-binding family protein [Entamoeba histolytica HM-3:IMSS]ENY61784.1 Myb family DNA-binding protein, SHAQKYF family protein, putative [Entamoeba histolytica HM-1:IMSS-A]GAT92988.1 myb family DNA-binding pr|eukprot:XP_655784.2 Myb family DNA-binding protein, SHAQKYF family [Entamoeba histolytica HM-1:IMSS]